MNRHALLGRSFICHQDHALTMPNPKGKPYYSDQELLFIRSKYGPLNLKTIMEIIVETGWNVTDIVEIRLGDIKHCRTGGLRVTCGEDKKLLFDSVRMINIWREDYPPDIDTAANPPLFPDTRNPQYPPLVAAQVSRRINTPGRKHPHLTTKRRPRFDGILDGLKATHSHYIQHPRTPTLCPNCHTRVSSRDHACSRCHLAMSEFYRKDVIVWWLAAEMMHDNRPFFAELDDEYWRLAMETAMIGREIDRLTPDIDATIELRLKDTNPELLDGLKNIVPLANRLSEYASTHERYKKAREQFRVNHDVKPLEVMLEEMKTRMKNPFIESYLDEILQKQILRIRGMKGDPTLSSHLDRVPDKGGE